MYIFSFMKTVLVTVHNHVNVLPGVDGVHVFNRSCTLSLLIMYNVQNESRSLNGLREWIFFFFTFLFLQ